MKRKYRAEDDKSLEIVVAIVLVAIIAGAGFWLWRRYHKSSSNGGSSGQKDGLNMMSASNSSGCQGNLLGQGYIIDGEEVGSGNNMGQIYNLLANGVPTSGNGCILGQAFDGSMQAVNVTYGNYGQSSMGGNFNVMGPNMPPLDTEYPYPGSDAVQASFYQ